jgi:RNA polymerase sigma factor (sigma-70 family)
MADASLGAVVRHLRQIVPPPADPRDDHELLDAFAARQDQAAFAVLVRRHGTMVLNVCRRVLHHEQDAEDAFQATFLVLVAKAPSFHRKTTLTDFLHGVAYHLALKARREAARRQRRDTRARIPACVDAAAELSWREVQAVLEEEIQRLPNKYRMPFVLCCLEGVGRAEAGRQLGLKEGTVWSRLSQAGERLRQRLTGRGIALSAVLGVMAVSDKTLRAGLVETVIQAAKYGSAGTMGGAASARVALLAQAGLRTMTGKMKLALVGLTALLAIGAGGAVFQVLTAKPPATPASMTPQAKAATEPKKPAAPPVRTDRHGDPLPDGALARLGTVRWRHGFGVSALVYSPDGKRIAAVGAGRALTLWDAVTGKEVRHFPNRGQPTGVAFSPDSKVLATTDYDHCHLWDVSTGKELRHLEGKKETARTIAFSPDGKIVAAGCYGDSLLWDSATGNLLRRLHGKPGEMLNVAFSPDGRLLASGGESGTIRLWNPGTGEEVRRMTEHKKEMGALAFSPDGKLLASGNADETLRLWNPLTGRQVRVLGEKLRATACVAFSRDGKRLASGHGDGTIRVWDPATGAEQRHWQAYPSWTHSVAFSPDGELLVSGGVMDSALRFWDANTGEELRKGEGHHAAIDSMRFTPDGRTLVSLGRDQQGLWWDLKTNAIRRRFTWPSRGRGAFALSADGKTLVAGGSLDQEVRVWDVRSDKPGRLLGKHEKTLWAVAVSPDGRLAASGGMEPVIRLWDTTSGKELEPVKGFTNIPFCLAFSPDGKKLACGLRRNNGAEPTLRMWDVSSGKEVCRFDSYDFFGMGLVFSPDGKRLASSHELGNQAYVRLWDTATGKELCRYTITQDIAWRIAFSPDGKLIACGTAGTGKESSIHLWEAATGQLIRRFEGHHSGVSCVAFSRDGLTLATGGGDSTILLWDILGRPRKTARTARELDACWTALAGEDATKAYDAVWMLVASAEQAVPFLQKHLRPVPRPDAKVVARLIADLDSNDFPVRDKATEELGKLGDAAAPALRQALAIKPALEVRKRLQQLLDQTRDWNAERLRDHRAIQALEHLGTPQAKQVLETLTTGAPEARRTEDAKASLKRLAR